MDVYPQVRAYACACEAIEGVDTAMSVGGKHMPFFDFPLYRFTICGPLRPRMWGGEPKMKDPEAAVAAAAAGGGNEACRGMPPSTSQQSAAEEGRMMPREPDIIPDIDVKPIARVYHLTYNDDDEYKVTRIEVESVATIRINNEQLSISDYSAIEEKMWDLDINDVKTLIENVENATAEKAFKFMAKRRELLDTLASMKVEIALEKVVEEEYFEDDYGDDP